MNALELRGLTKHYKDFTLGPLDLTLPGGTICGLIGENGAGKSTTIKLILDMLQKDGGTVTILGRDSRTDLVHTKEEIGVVLGSTRAGCCSVRKRTPCERNTPCGTARRRSWRHWMYGCTASGSPPTGQRRLCAGTPCLPGQSLPR